MTAVRTFPDKLSTSHILRPKRWEWWVGVLRRSNLTSSNSEPAVRGVGKSVCFSQRRPGQASRASAIRVPYAVAVVVLQGRGAAFFKAIQIPGYGAPRALSFAGETREGGSSHTRSAIEYF